MKVFCIYKQVGETPLDAIGRLVKTKHLPKQWKYTYAGRLDPLAEGVLLILANATQAQKEKYLRLNKAYSAEILFGLGTDTGDLLGLSSKGKNKILTKEEIQSEANKLIPKALLPLPAFSSIIVKGSPAFTYARAGKKIKMPLREMGIEKIEVRRKNLVTAKKLLQRINSRIKKVHGDFRQDKILKAWAKLLKNSNDRYIVFTLTIHCSSGTYIRSIAHHLGQTFKTKALLYGLKRTKVGKYTNY